MLNRPPIREAVKRAVRKKCGFGCVICGLPIYDYEHFEEFSDTQEHNEENLFLLCPNHHREKTNKLFDLESYKKHCEAPLNIQNGISTPYGLNFSGQNMQFILDTCTLIIEDLNLEGDELTPLIINDERIISFRFFDGQLLLTIKLYDNENNLILAIIDNEMIYGTDNWDVEFVGNNLKLREAKRKIIFDIDILPPGTVKINQGNFYKDNYELIVNDGKMVSKNLTAKIGNVINARILFSMGKCSDHNIGFIHTGV